MNAPDEKPDLPHGLTPEIVEAAMKRNVKWEKLSRELVLALMRDERVPQVGPEPDAEVVRDLIEFVHHAASRLVALGLTLADGVGPSWASSVMDAAYARVRDAAERRVAEKEEQLRRIAERN